MNSNKHITTHTEFDENNFKHAFDQYFESIRNFLYFKIGDTQAAEDIAQDAFIKLWEKRTEVNQETLKTFIYTIANNMAINFLRHGNVVFNFVNQQQRRDGSETDSPEYNMEMEEFNKKLQQAISSIPEKSREVFLMNRIEGLTYSEIGDRLSISVKAVEKRMKKALEVLRERINYKI